MKNKMLFLLVLILLLALAALPAHASQWITITPAPSPQAVQTAPPASGFQAVQPTPAPTPSLPAGAIGTVVVTNTRSVNVRASSNQNAKQIGLINPGEVYVCVGIADNGWCEIIYPTGGTGFVSGKLVRFTEGGSAQNTCSYVVGQVRILGGKYDARMTNGPSPHSDYMGYADPGRVYPCVRIAPNGWYAILREEKGYIVYVAPEWAQWISPESSPEPRADAAAPAVVWAAQATPAAPVEESPAVIFDPEVARIIRETLGLSSNTELHAANLAKLRTFEYDSVNDPNANGTIYDISMLALCTNLEEVDITNQPITSIEALRGLGRLKRVSLHGCTSLTDLSPLENKPRLEWLWINGVKVSDLSFLRTSPNLQFFNANWGTRITDLSVFAGMTALRTFYLNETPVADYLPLASHKQMEHVTLNGLDAATFHTLTDAWPALRGLGLTDSAIGSGDLYALDKYQLETLYLEGCPVDDLSMLATQRRLSDLRILDANVTDVSPIAELTRLDYCLDLRGNPIQDISPLGALTRLQSLYLSASEAYTEAEVQAIMPKDCRIHITQ